jgi:hypothetical protein
VYDAGFFDYLAFSCGNNVQLPSDADCDILAELGYPTDGSDLNLASIGVAALVGSQTVTRWVTSTSAGETTFTVEVEEPAGVNVTVDPMSLTLNNGDTAVYTVTLAANGGIDAGEWTFGSLTWANNADASNARSPIAVRTVELDAPTLVVGSGASGSESFDIGFGYSGNYAAGVHGLVEADAQEGNVADDPESDIIAALGSCDFDGDFPFVCTGLTWHAVAGGSAATRVALFDAETDGADDLDLYVFDPDLILVGQSGSFTSEELVDVVGNAPYYLVAVHGWETDGPDANYTLFSWSPMADELNLSVEAPNGVVELGNSETITVTWEDLAPGKYMGAISHTRDGEFVTGTAVSVDVP